MQIAALAHELEALLAQVTLRDPAAQIRLVCAGRDETPEPDVLYCVEEPGEEANLLTHAAGEGGNRLQLRPEVSLAAAVRQAQQVLLRDQRQQAVGVQLAQIFLTGRTLEQELQRSAALLGHSLVVTDPSYSYVAKALVPGPPGADLTELAARDAISEESMRHIQLMRLDKALAQGPVHHWNTLLGADTLISTLFVHGVEVGHLLLVQGTQPIGARDEALFPLLGQLVAQQLQKSEIFQGAEGRDAYFLAELLRDEHPDPEIMARRLARLRFQPKELFCLAVFSTAAGELEPHKARMLDWQISNSLQSALHTILDGRLVLLLTRRCDEAPDTYWCQMRRLAEKNELQAGASNWFPDLTQARRFHRQAEQAIHMGQAVPRNNTWAPLHLFQDFAFIDLLEHCRKSTNLMDYCYPLLLELLQYDRANHTDFMGTLYEFLQSGGNTQKAAASLFIHKNTLLYRMERIREILHNDLSDSWDIFLLNFSFRILMYLNIYRSDSVKKRWDERAKRK